MPGRAPFAFKRRQPDGLPLDIPARWARRDEANRAEPFWPNVAVVALSLALLLIAILGAGNLTPCGEDASVAGLETVCIAGP